MATVRLAKKLGLTKLRVWEGNLQKLGVSFYNLHANTLEGKPYDFAKLQGNVVLVSNVASHCAYAKLNYNRLVELDKKYRGKLQILAFPSNEFGKQEPNDEEWIRQFVSQFKVGFHMMEKCEVNGPSTHEVFRTLKKATGTEDQDIAWNFETKFLVAKEGFHVERFSNAGDPMDIVPFMDRLVGELEEPKNAFEQNEGPIKSPASFVETG
jgi:glutathione peroxidase